MRQQTCIITCWASHGAQARGTMECIALVQLTAQGPTDQAVCCTRGEGEFDVEADNDDDHRGALQHGREAHMCRQQPVARDDYCLGTKLQVGSRVAE